VISRNSISGAYPLKRLDKVVEFLDSKRRPVTESARRAGSYPYFGANGQQGTIDDYIFDEPLVLLAEDGGHFNTPERGIAYRISGKSWVNNHAHVLRPNDDMDLAFLCRVLENYDVTPFVTGTTRGKLTKSGASEILIPVPPLEEQKRIAEILDRAEELRSKRREAIAQLDTLNQSIFLEMFGDPVVNPKGWDWNTLGKICAEIYRYPTFYGFEYQETGTPVARIGNILLDGRLDPDISNYVFIDPAISRQFPRTILELQDIVMAVRGDGSTAKRIGLVTSDSLVSANISPNLLRFKAKAKVSHPLFLFHFMVSDVGQSLLESYVTRTAKKTITAEVIKKIKIPLPPFSLQHEFARRVEAVEKLKAAHRASLSELDALFASLQHRAFRGEL
jgi:type I restriction enzyme S subunit